MKRFLISLLNAKAKQRILFLMYLPCFPRDIFFCVFKNLTWNCSYRFYGLPRIQYRKRGSIRIGKHFHAVSDWRHNSIGLIQPVTLKTITPWATLIIGDHVGISGSTVSAAKSITIGNHVLIGSGCIITDSDAHPINPEKRRSPDQSCGIKPVVIEDDVFIGARSIILKGVRIGKGSMVGAGSVVSRDVPEYAIVAGNPARVVGDTREK